MFGPRQWRPTISAPISTDPQPAIDQLATPAEPAQHSSSDDHARVGSRFLRQRWKTFAFRTGGFVAVILLVILAIAYNPNFAIVKPGTLFRSAQPTKARLADYQAQYQLKSVINLRGTWPNQAWFSDEESACVELGLKLRHVDLRSYKLCPIHELKQLVRAYDELPKPILIHCRQGADRTGLAVAIFMLLDGASLAEARSAFTIRHGHTGWAYGYQYPSLLDEYTTWLDQRSLGHSASTFRQWVNEVNSFHQYHAEITLTEFIPAQPVVGKPFLAKYQVRNASRVAWQCTQRANAGVTPIAELRVPDGATIPNLTKHRIKGKIINWTTGTLAPGASTELTVEFPADIPAGTYDLLVDLEGSLGELFREFGQSAHYMPFTIK